MCLNPSVIYNNSHYLSTVHCKSFEFSVPCGKCSECKSQKKSEWRLRAFYEAKSCFKNHGFVVFDTLTYNDSFICRFSDYDYRIVNTCFDRTCFNRYDVTKFFKLLRFRLSAAGYDVKNKLRYFLTSEYGDDHEYVDDYGNLRVATERPHYHVLFFISFEIDPLVFSDFVADCWPCGRTDGRKYKGDFYFLNKRLFRGQNGYCNEVVNYVAKYVTKDFKYDKLLRSYVKNICNILLGDNWNMSFNGRKYFQSFYRNVGVFHVESKGFGLYALNEYDKDYIVENNSIPMVVNKKRVVVSVPCPQYYKRKLFYRVVWFNGQRMWIMNDDGYKYAEKIFKKSFNNYISRLRDLFSRVSSDPNLNAPAVFGYFRSVLNGRKWTDYIEYVKYVKGRVKSPYFELSTPFENALDSISPSSYNYKLLKDFQQLIYPCNTSADTLAHGLSCVSFNGYPNPKNFPNGFHDLAFDMIPSDTFKEFYTYNDASFPKYSSFDEIYRLLRSLEEYFSSKDEDFAKVDEYMYSFYKENGFFNKNF